MTPLQSARTRLLLSHPFYGTLLLMTPLVATTDIPTAATDMKHIFYNPRFFDKLSISEIMFVLAHEVMHIVLMHGMREQARHHGRWNDACDYAINLILVENGFRMPAPPNHGLLDRKWTLMSAEAIYARLPRRPPTGNRGSLTGDLQPRDAGVTRDQIRASVAQAVTAARLTGTLPAGLDLLVSDLLNPQVAWAEMLRHYMTQRATTRQDWTKRNRRFPTIYLPSRAGRKIGVVGIINDTSGSVDQRVRDVFAAEVRAVAEDTGAERIHVRHADTATQAEQWFECGEPITLRPKGGGGTDMRVPLAEFEAEREDVECVVMLTDGMTPWPTTEPMVPLIVCCTTDRPVPMGSVVRVRV